MGSNNQPSSKRRRFRRILFVTIVALAGTIGFFVVWHNHRPSGVPKAQITADSYWYASTFIDGWSVNHPTNSAVFAKVSVINQGTASLSFYMCGNGGIGYATGWAETTDGRTNLGIGRFTGADFTLPPGSNHSFYVWMPTNTLRWGFQFTAWTASVQERATSWILQRQHRKPWYSFLGIGMYLLPDKTGVEREITTETFEVPRGRARVPATNGFYLLQVETNQTLPGRSKDRR